MKQFGFLIVFTLLTDYSGYSQNLVPNPSFEEYETCPTDVTLNSVPTLVPGWFLPTRGTSDYYNVCARYQVGIPQNVMGNLFAIDGNAYAGIVLIEKPLKKNTLNKKSLNYREYLQAKLSEPLIKGNKYLVSLQFAIANNSTYATNSLGICLTVGKIKKRSSRKVLNYKPKIVLTNMPIIVERNYWHTLSDTITAEGGEEYITIGSFYDDLKSDYSVLSLSEFNNSLKSWITDNEIAYYYIDKVIVQKID